MDYKTFLAEAEKRRVEVHKLRKLGWTWAKIAAALNVTPQRAWQLGQQRNNGR